MAGDPNQALRSIPHRLREQARQRPGHPAYAVRLGGRWLSTTYQTYAEEVDTVARALIALGLAPEEKVCILGFNRPEWVLMDVGAMTAGGVPAGIYTTCSPEEVRYIVEHAEARIVLVENAEQWAKLDAERANLPRLEHVVLMRGAEVDDPLCMSWDAFLGRASTVDEAALEARLSKIRPEGVATFIYTSGTTGPPKAVMLSHRNLAWTAECARQIARATAEDRMLSYLPLSHIAEQMFTIHIPITVGATVHYARSMEDLPDDLREVRPTVFLGVPRVWEKMKAKLQSALEGATGPKAKLAAWAMGVGRRTIATTSAGKPAPLLLGLQYRIAERLVFSKVKARLGFDAIKVAVTGAAPISDDVLQFFTGLGITIHEVYGQSEGSGPTTFNQPGRTRFGTVGQALPGTEVRIAEDGEILARGPHVFLGYYKNPEATAETLKDGWLCSGDLGRLDADDFLKIVGRKKEIIVTAGGKNIAPKNIEAALKDLPLVSQAVVIGDRRPYLTALLTLDPEAAAALGASKDPHADPRVQTELQKGIDERVNPRFARVEQVRKFAVLPRDFSVEGGELTPSLKLKRRVVDERYAAEIDALYGTARARA